MSKQITTREQSDFYRKGAIDALSHLTDDMEQTLNKTQSLSASQIILLIKQTLNKFKEAPINELYKN